MDRIKCATFNKEMQDSIPPEIREKMRADRAKAEKEQEVKAKTLPIQCVMPRFSVSLVYQNVKSVMLRTLILNAKDKANALLETIEYFKEETDGMGLMLKAVTEINEV